jgi:hypothetical protein
VDRVVLVSLSLDGLGNLIEEPDLSCSTSNMAVLVKSGSSVLKDSVYWES